jgi:hypothetical protein
MQAWCANTLVQGAECKVKSPSAQGAETNKGKEGSARRGAEQERPR